VAQINSAKTSVKSGILLSIGGMDHLGITHALIEALKQATTEEVIATTGLGASSTLSPLDMAIAMARAQIGVVACGTTTWEAVCLKLPFVGIVTADNQIGIGESLVEQGIAQTVDCRSHIDIAKILNEIQLLLTRDSFDSKESALLIDGGGALRSAEQIYSLIH
jgi:spore coat polysaccharide biosynthesis predicted glycosyltransferase SpsG